MPKKKINKNILIDSTFHNIKGKRVKVADYISTEDCWLLEKDNRWVLTHKAIKILADVAGISKTYIVEESQNVVPDIRNELEHIVRVTITCLAKLKKTTKKGPVECVHSIENTLTVTGEANTKNTSARGRGYLRKMAEKRAYDIAVLEHLGLYTSTFSEEESVDFEKSTTLKQTLTPGMKEFDPIIPEVNKLLDAKNKAELLQVAKEIKKDIKNNKYSQIQIEYLRELHSKEHAKKHEAF